VLAPGIFLTDALIESELGPLGHTEDSFVEELVTQGMSARMGTVDEMAATILFLCSPAARYICGATLVADGASTQGNWVSSLLPGADEF
jgi:NAD(P)-dependent dehydrogenase (short-subunit alcohol dehydrogenase family)